MRRKRGNLRRRILPVLAIALLAMLIGRAALASNSVGATSSGYGTGTVSGATVQNVAYTLSPDGTTITGATLTLVGDLSGKVVSVGFNASAMSSCVNGLYLVTTNTTSATCGGLAQSNVSAGTLAVAVHQ